MPLYEYRCPTCRSTFEKLQPMNRADEPAPCPNGHAGATRVVSLVAARAWGGSDGASLPSMTSGCACGGACSCGGH
jgi:putative FmdB family regulatory protein